MSKKAVVLFDGVCNLCNGVVQKIIVRDKKNQFKFASLQSDYGQELLTKHKLNTKDFDTFILQAGDKIYTRSTAALRVVGKLGGLYSMVYVFFIIPPFIRNSIYSYVSKNRYRWFGRQESCWLPRPEWQAKFIG